MERMNTKIKSALETIKADLRFDDPHGHYDLVWEALRAVDQQPLSAAFDVVLSEDDALLLRSVIGDEAEAQSIRLSVGEGYGGYGLYARSAECPEEGGTLIRTIEAPSPVPEEGATEAQPPQFPTMLRKMWSGEEVQAWINKQWKGIRPEQMEEIEKIFLFEELLSWSRSCRPMPIQLGCEFSVGKKMLEIIERQRQCICGASSFQSDPQARPDPSHFKCPVHDAQPDVDTDSGCSVSNS